MDSRQHDQNAEDRFQERRAERAAQLDKAAKGIVDFTDMLRRDARRAILHPNDGQGLERILGVSDLLEVNFLDIGRRAGRVVAEPVYSIDQNGVAGKRQSLAKISGDGPAKEVVSSTLWGP